MSETGTLYIVAAPSGGGKTSLVAGLLDTYDNLRVSISHTTRPIRPGEEEGVSYFFVSEDKFQQMVDHDEFLEYAHVYDHHYGTERAWVLNKLEKGVDLIFDIDWQGARQICRQFPQAVTIFILPPSIETLRQRLEKRRQDDERVIEQRMEQAMSELSHLHEFEYLVVNDDFDVALEDMKSIVRSKRLTRQNQADKLAALLSSFK